MKMLEFLQYINHGVLLEARLDYLKDTYGEKLAIASGMEPDAIFNLFVDADPDPQNKATQWLIKNYLNGNMKLDDLQEVTRQLTTFNRIKSKLPTSHRNLLSYNSMSEVSNVIDEYYTAKNSAKKTIEDKMRSSDHSETIYDSPYLNVVIPKTEEAACYFGIDTKWCTAYTSEKRRNEFDEWNDRGELYVIDVKGREKFQFHLNDRALMNSDNKPLKYDTVVKRYPEIDDAIGDIIAKKYPNGFIGYKSRS